MFGIVMGWCIPNSSAVFAALSMLLSPLCSLACSKVQAEERQLVQVDSRWGVLTAWRTLG